MFEAFSIYGKIALQGMGLLNQELSGLQQKIKQVGTGMQSAGRKMTMGLTLPLIALGGAAFKMSGDFDQAMRATNVMLKASESEMKSYKKEILDLSKATGKSSGDIAKSFYTIVSAGYRGADAMDILTTSIEGAVGGAAEAQSTTEALTKAMNIFQLKGVEGSSRAMDVFFGIVDTGLLTFEELAQAFPMAATSAAGLKVSIEETGAALATLTKVSGSTRMASTALNAVFTQLIKPSEDMLALFREWGVETGPEAIEKFGGLQGVLLKVTEATGGNVSELAKLFPNVEAIRAVLPLTTTNAQDFADALVTVSNSTGRAGEAFEEMAQGPGYQLNVFLATMKALMITIGDTVSKKFGPILTTFTEKIGKLSKWIENLTDEQANLYLKLGLVLAAAGPVLYIFGTMITTVNTLTVAFKAMRVAAHGALGPISIALAVLVGMGIAVNNLTKNMDDGLSKQLIRGAFLVSSITQAVNIWQRATWVADQTQQGLWKTLFMSKRAFYELEESLIVQQEYYNKVTAATLKYAEAFPVISRNLQDLINDYNTGTISQEAFNVGTGEIIKNTQDYIKYQRLLNKAIKGRDIILYQEKIIALAKTMGIATDESKDFADIQKEVEEVLGLSEEATEDLIDSVDELIASLYKLYNLNQSVTEATWDYEDSLAELDEVMKDANSTEKDKQKAIFGTQDSLENLQIAMAKELEDTETSIERKRELQNEYIKTGLEAVTAGATSEEAFLKMAATFGLTTADIIKFADEMGIKLDEETHDRIINIKVNLDDAEFYSRVGAVRRKINEIGTGFMAGLGVSKKASGGIVGYSDGGVTSNSRSVLVGELGPEIAEFPVGTRIIPNNQISKVSSEAINITNHYNITTPKPLSESGIKRETDMLSRELGYRMGI